MRTRTWMWMIGVYLFAALIIPTALLAQEQQEREHHRYILKDLGTFGGPSSALNIGVAFLSSHGMAVGAAETPMLDPPNSNGFPCGPGLFVYHGFEWQNGVLTDLGAL